MTVSIAIVGTGYVGLVTGTCLAELGHDVVCVDNDTSKIDALNAGRIPIYEPGLDELVASNVRRGTLRFSTDLAASVAAREAVFIAVGTPTSEGSDHANVDGVLGVAAQTAPYLTQFTVVVTKSTVPVGTNRRVQCILDQHLPEGVAAAAASNPEFLREGSAIEDFMHPDRVVFGSESEAALAIMRRIYAPLEARGHQIVETEIETAEVIKYAANAFLAVKISYINEVAELCEAIGADVERVATGIGLDHRIGAAFLQAGPGWGGSCFPKDTRALRATANDHRVTLRVVDAAISANLERRDTIVRKVQAACGGSLEGKRIAVLGLTFKGQTDDLRESPSVDVIRALVAEGAKVRAYDPSQPHDAAKLLPGVGIAAAPLGAVRGAELLLVLTDWKAFRELQLDELAAHMADPVMVDLRNLYDEATVMRCGFRYYTRIGRTAAPFVPLVRGHRHPSLAAYASIAAANDGSLRKVGASATSFEVAKAAATLEVAFDPVLPEATLLDAPGITATGHVSL